MPDVLVILMAILIINTMKTSYLACTSLNCRKTFRNESSLRKHLIEDHSENEQNPTIGYRCKKCKRVLGTKQSLKEHFYTHTGQKPYRCNEPGCGKFFRQSSQLSYHKKIHTEVKRYFKDFLDEDFKLETLGGNDKNQEKTFESKDISEAYLLPQITCPQFDIKLPSIFS